MDPIFPKEGSQEYRVLQALLAAKGAWISKRVFVYGWGFTQAGRAIYELENRYHWPIEHSAHGDERGFKSYRIKQPEQAVLPI
jgi:hypothetical protein